MVLAVVLVVGRVVLAVYEHMLRYGPYAEENGFADVFWDVGQQADMYLVCGILVILIVVLIAYLATRRYK